MPTCSARSKKLLDTSTKFYFTIFTNNSKTSIDSDLDLGRAQHFKAHYTNLELGFHFYTLLWNKVTVAMCPFFITCTYATASMNKENQPQVTDEPVEFQRLQDNY